MRSFARRSSYVSTGSERRIQSVLPSSETDGAVKSTMPLSRQAPSAATTATAPPDTPSWKSASAILLLTATRATAAQTMNTRPSPALSMKVGLLPSRTNSRRRSAAVGLETRSAFS